MFVATIIAKLMEQFPDIFATPVHHTSRAPRPGEEHGVHYFFVQKSDIEGAIQRNEYIDHHAEKNTLYGLKISTIDDIRRAGKICLVDLEMKFLPLVKQSMMVVKYLFIAPPSIPSLGVRLKSLSEEPLAQINARIVTAEKELEMATADENIDKILVNDNLDQCINRLIYQLDGWYTDFNFHENDGKDED